MTKFDLVLLDADGTLFDYDQAETMALSKLFAQHQFPFNAEVLTRYRSINGGVWADFEHGRISKEDLQKARFARLLAALDLPGEGEVWNSEYLDHLGEGNYLLPGAEQVCRELSKHCKLAIATNGISRTQRSRVEMSSIKDYISNIVVSEEAGYQKPQTGFFQYAFDLCGHTDKSRAIMVGDALVADISGGAAFGISTCWYNPGGKATDQGHQSDYQITRLEELLTIILG